MRREREEALHQKESQSTLDRHAGLSPSEHILDRTRGCSEICDYKVCTKIMLRGSVVEDMDTCVLRHGAEVGLKPGLIWDSPTAHLYFKPPGIFWSCSLIRLPEMTTHVSYLPE